MCLKMGDFRKYPYQLYHGRLPYFNPPPPSLAFRISKLHYPPIPSEFHHKNWQSPPPPPPPPPPSLPSEFPNCIILPYPRNSIPPPLFAFIFSSNPSELLTLDSGNSGMKIRSFLFATFQQMRPTLPLNCPELVQNIKELQILNGVLSQ